MVMHSISGSLCTPPLPAGLPYIVLGFLVTVGGLADKDGTLRGPPDTGKDNMGTCDPLEDEDLGGAQEVNRRACQGSLGPSKAGGLFLFYFFPNVQILESRFHVRAGSPTCRLWDPESDISYPHLGKG